MKLRVAVLAAFFAVALTSGAGSQVSAQKRGAPEDLSPRKFDEFGSVRHCDVTARLDNLAIQVQNEPGSTGYLVAYGPDGEGFGTGQHTLSLLQDYLLNTRGLTERHVKTIYAGRNDVLEEPRIQLWITPRGGAAPEPVKFETKIETFKGLFSEEEREDYLDLDPIFESEMGPGIPLATDAAFADMLHQQKKAIAYVVAYNGESAVPGAARRRSANQIESLKRYNVEAGRIKTIFGGVRKKSTVQLWILSPGDPPPVTDAGPEPPPKKNVQIMSESDEMMGTPKNERAVFSRLLEVLRDQPTLKTVVFVKLEQPEPETEPESEPTMPIEMALPPQSEEPLSPEEEDAPPADLPKLVEKWREELTGTHKISSDRFIVLFTNTGPYISGNYVEVWAMPPGQPLPDPHADEEETEDPDKAEDNEPPYPASPLGSRIGSLIRPNNP